MEFSAAARLCERYTARMTGFLQTYPHARSTGRCAATGEAFATGQPIMALLLETPRGIERVDYSVVSWEQGSRPEAGVIGLWRGVHQAEPAPRDALVSDEELLDIFESTNGAAASESDAKQLRFRYVLTLLLLRKRLLRGVGTRIEHGQPVMLVERKGQPGQTITVIDPRMDEMAIAEAVEQVGQVLGIGASGT
jgi:hypothetical protein